MGLPLAYFVTWHTYGSRLHGDVKGSVDYHHRDVNMPVLGADPAREAASAARMGFDAVELDEPMRAAVVEQVVETCGYRGWVLWAVHARVSHVHAVVSAAARVEKVLVDLKAYTTRRLRKEGLIGADRPVWSEHGSTRYLWEAVEVDDKVRYTLEGQGRPMARWPEAGSSSSSGHEA